MKTLHIDEKWKVQYDPDNNDRPVLWLRNGEPLGFNHRVDNLHVAMFYALLEAERAVVDEANQRVRDQSRMPG